LMANMSVKLYYFV